MIERGICFAIECGLGVDESLEWVYNKSIKVKNTKYKIKI